MIVTNILSRPLCMAKSDGSSLMLAGHQSVSVDAALISDEILDIANTGYISVEPEPIENLEPVKGKGSKAEEGK